MFEVSVVIPVYNASKYVERAVDSALIQPEVKEVLLIEDNSPDDSYHLCIELQKKFQNKVKVFIHKGHLNKGAAACRNLGIENASYPYIAFLDADDFYLPGRFNKTQIVFSNNSEADGVYEAIGTHAYDQKGYDMHIERINACKIEGLNPEYTTLTKHLPPEELFEALVYLKYGWFHFGGLTLHAKFKDKTGLIKEELSRYGEDNEFFLRLALKAKLYPGNIESPVAKRGVYADNVTLNTSENQEVMRRTFHGSVILYKFVFNEIISGSYSKKFNRYSLMRHLDHYSVSFLFRKVNFLRRLIKMCNLMKIIIKNPIIIRKII